MPRHEIRFTRATYGATILRAMRQLGPTTCTALRAPTGLRQKVLRRLLAELERDGLVCHAGTGAGTRWVVGTHPPAALAPRARRHRVPGDDALKDDDAIGSAGRYVSRPRTPVYADSPWVGKTRAELAALATARATRCSASREGGWVSGVARAFWGLR